MEVLIPESRAIDIAKRAAREKDETFDSSEVASKKLSGDTYIIELKPTHSPLGILDFRVQVRVSSRNGRVLQVYSYSVR